MAMTIRTIAGVAWIAASCALAGCAPTQLSSPAASAVRITNNEPAAGCTYLGDVTGSQGDFVRGVITANADLETGARNDIKNKAAAMGGNLVYLLTQRAGQTGGKDRLEQTNVTLSGNVYRCASLGAR
ncbi:MAG: DUF4156 domain-containing protein [Rhodoferax sp.]|nr:DUF4156 domain-containing protein [Rhodoferax sp.]